MKNEIEESAFGYHERYRIGQDIVVGVNKFVEDDSSRSRTSCASTPSPSASRWSGSNLAIRRHGSLCCRASFSSSLLIRVEIITGLVDTSEDILGHREHHMGEVGDDPRAIHLAVVDLPRA